MEEIEFSIIIPMYNAADTIGASIESVIRQSCTSWEIIIVDDCSTDGSANVCKSYLERHRDLSIRLISLSENSGNAKKPWDTGILASRGKYCLKLDSDDVLEIDYLSKMYTHIKRGADVVIPIMMMVDKISGKVNGKIPNGQFDDNSVLSGKDACKLTIPEWKIGCGGMAFRRSLYDYVFSLNNFYYMNSDELSERIILYYADKVSISNAEYIYYQHPQSITHKPSKKLCEMLYVDNQIIDFVRERYDSELLKLANQKLLSRLIILQKQYLKNKTEFNQKDWEHINDVIRENYKTANWHSTDMNKYKTFAYSRGYVMFRFICYSNAIIDKLKQKCISR